MRKRTFIFFMSLLLAVAAILWGVDRGLAETDRGSAVTPAVSGSLQSGQNTDYERHQQALERLDASMKAQTSHPLAPAPESMPLMPTGKTTPPYSSRIVKPAVAINPLYPPGIGFNPAVDYTKPNFSQSPNIRKFINGLPGLGLSGCTQTGPGTGNCNENNLGQYIPVAVPDTTTFPGSEYYVIGVGQYQKQMNTDLPASGATLRGYYQINGTDHSQQHLGPAVIAHTYNPVMPPGYVNPSTGFTNGKPVRFRFENHLAVSPGDALPLPVDTVGVMGAGMGPVDLTGATCDYGSGAICASYTQNRAVIHLHGGNTPWISDGTPHQWITPAGDLSPLRKGMSFNNVPDMVNTPAGAQPNVVNGVSVPCAAASVGTCFTPTLGDGIGTHFYTNEQSARLMFFHDHAYGLTRLNVYDGMAAPYILVDQVEDDLIDGTNKSGVNPTGAKVLPNLGGCLATALTPGACAYRYGIPLVFQDKSFVNDTTTDNMRSPSFPLNYVATAHTADPLTPLTNTDPLWATYVGTTGGNLWFPHEYMPIENVFDPSGNTPNGRWDYAPFMIPPGMPLNLTLPSPTIVPESFLDTAVVNGTAFPYLNLPADAVRFRILSAGNDRSFNLQLYNAAVGPALVTFTGGGCTTQPIASTSVHGGVVTGITILSSGSGCTSAPTVAISDVAGHTPTLAASAPTATVANGVVTGITLSAPNFGGTGYLAGTICKGIGTAQPAGTNVGTTWAGLCTEVSMVAAAPNPAYPSWPIDGRDGGVPNPTTQGPAWIQIGNETGLLAQVAVWPQQPIDYEYNRQNIPFGGITSRTLFLMPAMRADVIVDLWKAGDGTAYQTGDMLIVYNDAPAPAPLFWTINDYYTDDPDQRGVGAAPPTPAGFGPNTRTMMQIRIAANHTSPLDYSVKATPGFDRSSPIGSFLAPNLNPPFGATYTSLQTILPKAFAATQDKPLVPQMAYNAAFPSFATVDTFAQAYMETLNLSGVAKPLSRIMTVGGGNNYTTPPVVNIVSSVSNCPVQPTATAGINPAGAITLLTAGSGYTSPPTVTLGAPGAGGVQATAVADISAGIVNSISIVEPGSNYSTTVAPTCTVSAPPAPGVAATCSVFVATANVVGSITLTNPGLCFAQPEVFLVNASGIFGVGATATALVQGALVMTGKNLTEGFDPDYGRMDIRLGSTPNPLTPNIGNGFAVGVERYIDPPNEFLSQGQTIIWRLTHLGVDSHAMHFHLFNLQVVNRVDYTNVVKPPYLDELGWREVIRTNPMEDIIVAIQPKSFVLPFPLPQSNRPLDVTTPLNSTTNFLPVAPPAGIAAVPQITNLMTNFGFEYVWHCHLLGHEENDMMRPMVLNITPIASASAPAVAWNPTLGKYHVAIRNANNTVSIGTANVDGVVNNDFVQLPSGSTLTNPSIAWDPTHNKLIVAWKGAATTNLFVGSLNADGSGWSGTTSFAAGTTASPAIAWNLSTQRLNYAILASANTVWVGALSFNGVAFTSPSQVALTGAPIVPIGSAPAITTATTGTIYLAAKSTATTINIYVGSVSSSLSGFSGWKNLPAGTTATAVGVTLNAAGTRVEVVNKGNATTGVFVSAINTNLSTGFVPGMQINGAVSTDVPAVGIDPLLPQLNIFTLNGGNISGYTTPAL